MQNIPATIAHFSFLAAGAAVLIATGVAWCLILVGDK